MDNTAPAQRNPEDGDELRKKRVLYLRHRLQSGFFFRGGHRPREEDMPGCDKYLARLEENHADLRRGDSIFKGTKVHKVLKLIHFYQGEIPLEETYQFRKRAGNLLRAWGFPEDTYWDGAICCLQP
ncbi:hypothetical protein P154DRAFT_576028 [Amniculicola lignicola CBS 123094]|uniref:Uncharacterized protein n=1 Tax=Amniculicola lignicola CBS 123094 TaxID=1392246 RepID=A0A6A5WS11_9PLEO|nr:hypothetical protein P154DRAFT_576028 [Amniculicola lignicola CBS 123094]